MEKQYDYVTSRNMRNLTLEISNWLNMNYNNFDNVSIRKNCKDGLYIATIEYWKNGGEIIE